jgi:hypothetical protein
MCSLLTSGNHTNSESPSISQMYSDHVSPCHSRVMIDGLTPCSWMVTGRTHEQRS